MPASQENYEKNIGSHDMNDALRLLYPHIRERENNVHLPRRWDSTQASSYLELHPNGLIVTFKKNASIQGDKDPSGVVRSDSHIPASVGTYYFEVRILHGHRGVHTMGVGLSKHGGELNRMPGWDPNCYGYHGDDGNFFSACGHGTAYGPRFGTGDVIGCGMDTTLNEVFFTKNGKHLRVAHTCKPGELDSMYPTVGLKTPGERLFVNFGQTDFVFDFDGYRDHLNNRKIRMLEDVQMPTDIGSHMDRMVASFLGHSGALETLKCFEKVARLERPVDHEFVKKRKEISDMVLSATNGAVIQEKIEEYFPGCLEKQKKVQLILLCLRYIDLANTMQKAPPSFRATTDEPRDTSPVQEIRSRPPKLLKGTHCKSTKRVREQKKHPKVHTPPPVRRTDAKANEDLCLKNSKIDSFYTDEDTGEEMISIDGLCITKRMYVELYTSDEYGKLAYLINLGREIMLMASTTEKQLTEGDRKILEAALMHGLAHNPVERHPLNAGQRRYISNVVIKMINDYKPPGSQDPPAIQAPPAPSAPSTSSSKPEKSERKKEKEKKKAEDGEEKKKEEKQPLGPEKREIYSELRGLFLAWKGLHHDAASRDSAVAAIYFMRNMALEELKFEEKPVVYSDEPMEQENGGDAGASSAPPESMAPAPPPAAPVPAHHPIEVVHPRMAQFYEHRMDPGVGIGGMDVDEEDEEEEDM